jgi:catechol 2,3-dioxygenase-like lactoylglutathione lyase family enzyme
MAPRPSIAPSLTCNDVDKTYDYFTGVLGFAGLGKWKGPDGSTMHASVVMATRNGEASLMLGPLAAAASGAYGDMGQFGENLKRSPDTLGNGVVLFLNVPDVDKYHAFISGKGALIDEPPTDQFWGDRTISVLTPDNYYLTFASPIKGWKAPPGMGDADASDVRKATFPGAKRIPLPGQKKPAKAKAAKVKAAKGKAKPAKGKAGKNKR